MHRRSLLQLAGWSALAACTPRIPRTPQRIGAVAFDLFTIFDPRGIERRCAEVAITDAPAFASAWLARLFDECWLRALAEQYAPFDTLVAASLDHVASLRHVVLGTATRTRLAAAFTELEPWPDSLDTLRALRDRGILLAPLANFAPTMIDELLAHSHARDLFAHVLSTDLAHTYKPAPRAYALAEHAFGLPRSEIAFAAFGAWDAWGANAFGLRTFWVNRLGVIDARATGIPAGPDLAAFARWVRRDP